MEAFVSEIIPAYPFVQYNDDPGIVAFFNAYNTIAQKHLQAFNKLSLPFWPSESISGYLLDWIAAGIYGQARPSLQVSESAVAKGAYDTSEYNSIAYAKPKNYRASRTLYVADDYFKRILTWNFYKGDGFHFSTPWLKRRVARFLHGVAGEDPKLQNSFDVSIKSTGGIFSITIPDYADYMGKFLKLVIEQRLVNLPFIYQFDVTVGNS